MSSHAHAADHGHSDNKFEIYVQIAMLLAVITGVEIIMVYLPFLKWLLISGLVVLSIVKFMFVIFYLLLLRPQQQRQKQLREMIANIRRGDTVVTSGGIIGKVTKVKDDGEILVEIADNTSPVRVVKDMVVQVRVKGEPVKETA